MLSRANCVEPRIPNWTRWETGRMYRHSGRRWSFDIRASSQSLCRRDFLRGSGSQLPLDILDFLFDTFHRLEQPSSPLLNNYDAVEGSFPQTLLVGNDPGAGRRGPMMPSCTRRAASISASLSVVSWYATL